MQTTPLCTTYSSVDGCELCFEAVHAGGGVAVRHPHGRVLLRRLPVGYTGTHIHTLHSHQDTPLPRPMPHPCHSLLARRSTIHLLMCAIHSAFSVAVAANTAKDFFGEITCHPFFQATKTSYHPLPNHFLVLPSQSHCEPVTHVLHCREIVT